MNQYEAMFIFDPTYAVEAGKAEAEIERLMQRAGGEITLSRKWEERKLAFEIKKRKRGSYYLTYFKADPKKIGGIERDCALSDDILRVLIVRADGLSPERMEAMYHVANAGRDEDGGESGDSGGFRPRRHGGPRDGDD